MKKRPDQTDKTRQQIVDAFWELYEERPIERITVKEIVAKAECHRSTFYEYFDNVYEILDSIERDLLADFEDDFWKAPENPTAEDIIRHQIETFEGRGRFLSVLVSENGDPAFAKKMQDKFAEKIKPRISSNLSDDHIAYINQFTAGGLSSVMTKWLREGGILPVEDLLTITHVFKDYEAKILKGEIGIDLIHK